MDIDGKILSMSAYMGLQAYNKSQSNRVKM